MDAVGLYKALKILTRDGTIKAIVYARPRLVIETESLFISPEERDELSMLGFTCEAGLGWVHKTDLGK